MTKEHFFNTNGLIQFNTHRHPQEWIDAMNQMITTTFSLREEGLTEEEIKQVVINYWNLHH